MHCIRDRPPPVNRRLRVFSGLDEATIYADAAAFLEAEFDAEVVVERETDDAGAVPFRPSIDLETA